MQTASRVLEEGGLVIAVDEAAGRGFFAGVAALASPASVNVTLLWGRGLTCFAVDAGRALALGLLPGGDHTDSLFLRSVEAATCTGTGISAADRAETLRAAGAPNAGAGSLKSPGHVIPALAGSPRSSAGAALALVRQLTGHDVAAWTDILGDAGDVASAAYCRALADRLGVMCLGLKEGVLF